MSDSTIRLILPGDSRFSVVLHASITAVAQELAELGYLTNWESLAEEIYLAAHEACMNVIDHAYEAEAARFIFITVQANAANRTIEVVLEDNGRAYDPQAQEWPPMESWHTHQTCDGPVYVLGDVPEPDIFQERGRGLYLMTQLLESVSYQPQPNNNCWHLLKRY
ncbi:MAG: ATP-binding protein [Chloroflexi bacterium]|nr:ATP-binding protein [Chloroflexota bacterium]MBP7044903.1 ATP-binding protein [Chloroflexota bacterium]